MTVFSGEYTRYAIDVRAGLPKILEVPRAGEIAISHLNEPDRRTDFQITIQEVDKLHKGGKFERFSLGNFMSRKGIQICGISKKNGWTMPSVYQGNYKALYLTTKSEPFPCFRD
jgi:aflatoxin B1 aldehyde reductase